MRANLTRGLLNAPPSIPEGKRKLQIFDQKTPGFLAEIRETCITFYMKWKDEAGRTRMLKIGRLGTDVTLEQARKRAVELRGQRAMGIDPYAERERRRTEPTVAEFVDHHFMPHQKTRKRSWREDEKLLFKRVTPVWGRRRLSTITTADVQRLHDGIVASGRTPATANRHLACVKRMFSLAVTWGELDRNPAQPVKLIRENNQRHRYLSKDEIAGLLAALTADSDQVGAAAIAFLLMTGARVSEALGARWSNIDAARNAWLIPNPKGGRAVHKPLSEAVLALLRQVPRVEGNPYLFPGHRDGERRTCLRNTWKRVCKAAGIEGCRLHDLRHTYASLLVGSGASPFVVQQLLNHSTPTMTQRYAHLAPGHLLEAANLAGRLVTDAQS